jgi:lysyl-tRNA synthetase class 2
MLTTGMERVFEIGRTFRDEPADPTHAPEHSLVELYQAGADYETLRVTVRELIATAATAATGGTVIHTRGGNGVDLAAPWPVVSFYEAVSTAAGEEITPGTTAGRLRELASRRQVPVRAGASADDIALCLYDQLVEPGTTGPTIYADFPAGPSPLARACPHDRRLAQKWDLVIDGREIATAYTEQADPDELRRRLAPDGDRILSSEAATLDGDWLAVFTAGMPPAGGLCIGLERLMLTLTGSADLRDVIPFPLPPAP